VLTLYPQKVVLTSPISGGRSVCEVRLRTQATKFSLVCYYTFFCKLKIVYIAKKENFEDVSDIVIVQKMKINTR
jgi:hypothetical protein